MRRRHRFEGVRDRRAGRKPVEIGLSSLLPAGRLPRTTARQGKRRSQCRGVRLVKERGDLSVGEFIQRARLIAVPVQEGRHVIRQKRSSARVFLNEVERLLNDRVKRGVQQHLKESHGTYPKIAMLLNYPLASFNPVTLEAPGR